MTFSLYLVCLALLGSSLSVDASFFHGMRNSSGGFQAKLCAMGRTKFCQPPPPIDPTIPTSSTSTSLTDPTITSESSTPTDTTILNYPTGLTTPSMLIDPKPIPDPITTIKTYTSTDPDALTITDLSPITIAENTQRAPGARGNAFDVAEEQDSKTDIKPKLSAAHARRVKSRRFRLTPRRKVNRSKKNRKIRRHNRKIQHPNRKVHSSRRPGRKTSG